MIARTDGDALAFLRTPPPEWCSHRLTVDECALCHASDQPDCGGYHGGLSGQRRCLGCGHAEPRASQLAALREAIRRRHRLPSSPWSAEERSGDPT